MAKAPKYSRNPAARLAFHANRNAIADALANGQFMQVVFDELKLPGSYAQFTRYVAKHLPDVRPTTGAAPLRPESTPSPAPSPSLPETSTPATASEGPKRPRPKATRPVYDPSKINADDLY